MLLAALGLAAVAPSAAGAEDGVVPAPSASLSDAVALASEIVGETEVADSLSALPVEAPLELAAAAAGDVAAEPAPTAAAPEPTADTAPEPASQPAPEPAAEAAPGQTPTAPAPAPDPPPSAVQAEPTNVNVSVRVDSPGDDGAVEQANVAVELPSGQYLPEPVQYQPPVPTPDAPATAAEAPAPASESPAEPGWQWSWEWDCGGGAIPAVDLPQGVAGQSWIWNWNWDCGTNETAAPIDSNNDVSGYHSSPVQYRPVNINVAIRINSPGNNGSVAQTNVALRVAVPPLPAVTIPVPTISVPVATEPGAAVPSDHLPAVVVPAELAASFESVFTAVVAGAATELAAFPGAVDVVDCCLLPELRDAAVAPERPARSLAGGTVTAATGIDPHPGDTVAVVAQLELRVRGAAQAAEAAPRPQARPARPAPRRVNGEEKGPAAAPHESLGFAAVGGPERTLPFAALVLLAFLFASTLSTLVSAWSRPTRQAEADGPPDRPG